MFSHMLCPISDFSLENGNLQKLVELAKKDGATVTLTHVSDPAPPVFYTQDGFDGNFITTDEHMRACKAYSEGLFKKANAMIGNGIKVDTLHVFDSDVTHGILDAAEQTKSDVIAMMSHKHTGLLSLFADNETIEVVQGARIPVVVI